MAIEAMKAAAMTYQGSASGAAKPVKVKEPANTAKSEKSVKTSKPAMESGGKAEPGIIEEETVKPMQPVRGNAEDTSGQSGSSNGHQTSRQLQEAVEKLKKNMMAQTEAVFGIHEGTNRVMIKIVDKESKDVVKEYPPEETLDMIQKVWEMAGILVDEKG